MKKRLPTILLVVVFLVGLSLLLYPAVSDYVNSLHQTRAISSYTQQVAGLDNDLYEEEWESAQEYNAALNERVWSLELKTEGKPRRTGSS